MNGDSSALYQVAAVFTALYGVCSIVGGGLGYVRAASVVSLVAGGVAGLLLLLCAAGIFYRPSVSLGGAILVAVLLIVRFLPSLLQVATSNQPDPFAGNSKGIVALILVIGGVDVILVSILALLAGRPNAP